jgi:site-specific DNA recombinase
MKTLRCAIYTRKSTEEGLEQGFNSLHAQREACAAYTLSQAGEGWSKIETVYDDGGYSGGSMDRPGLRLLLDDIAKGRIDVVVVYKVDRLTRSLADFARIVELFDQKGVSFVSVTQAFNTTTSMGRLTLNVLLSFAQFEREVTGERIRDKIAASKKKGLWMGGRPPLGYDGVERKLVPNPSEAEAVRFIFRRYLELGSVLSLEADLRASAIGSKRWTNRKGDLVGGAAFTRGALYWLLSNPVYRGGIRHRDAVYPNAHPAIIDLGLWDAVQAKLKANGPDLPATSKVASPALLKGLIYDGRGVPMATSLAISGTGWPSQQGR